MLYKQENITLVDEVRKTGRGIVSADGTIPLLTFMGSL